jgi:hypothetical protein
MASAMRPFYVTFRNVLPALELEVTPGKVYDVLSVQMGIKPTGEREIYLVIEDDAGRVDMIPARLCEILDASQIG